MAREIGGSKAGVGSRIRGLQMVGKGSKRKESKIQWKRDMKEKMRHADRTATEGKCCNESEGEEEVLQPSPYLV